MCSPTIFRILGIRNLHSYVDKGAFWQCPPAECGPKLTDEKKISSKDLTNKTLMRNMARKWT